LFPIRENGVDDEGRGGFGQDLGTLFSSDIARGRDRDGMKGSRPILYNFCAAWCEPCTHEERTLS